MLLATTVFKAYLPKRKEENKSHFSHRVVFPLFKQK